MKNGQRNPRNASIAPTSGPTTLPKRNAVEYVAEARPRMLGGARRTISPIADTVNMVDPMPAAARSPKTCQKFCASDTSPVVTPTVNKPMR